jgi:hypothetical protein
MPNPAIKRRATGGVSVEDDLRSDLRVCTTRVPALSPARLVDYRFDGAARRANFRRNQLPARIIAADNPLISYFARTMEMRAAGNELTVMQQRILAPYLRGTMASDAARTFGFLRNLELPKMAKMFDRLVGERLDTQFKAAIHRNMEDVKKALQTPKGTHSLRKKAQLGVGECLHRTQEQPLSGHLSRNSDQ